jgi:hypothetical protein
LYNSVGVTFSILLPIPSGNANSEIGVKNNSDSSNVVTVIGTGSVKIDDLVSDLLASPRVSKIYKSTGTGFIII